MKRVKTKKKNKRKCNRSQVKKITPELRTKTGLLIASFQLSKIVADARDGL